MVHSGDLNEYQANSCPFKISRHVRISDPRCCIIVHSHGIASPLIKSLINFVNFKFSASTSDPENDVSMSDVESDVDREQGRHSSAELSTLTEGRDNADLFEARQPNFPSEQVSTVGARILNILIPNPFETQTF